MGRDSERRGLSCAQKSGSQRVGHVGRVLFPGSAGPCSDRKNAGLMAQAPGTRVSCALVLLVTSTVSEGSSVTVTVSGHSRTLVLFGKKRPSIFLQYNPIRLQCQTFDTP